MPDAQVSLEPAEETTDAGSDIFYPTKSIGRKPLVPEERI